MNGCADDAFSRLRHLIGDSRAGRLAAASVLLCGTGGVGSWAAECLARSAVGHVTLMDPDTVRPSNINRQLCALHSTIGRRKVDVLAERMRDIAPMCDVTALPVRLEPGQCEALVREHAWNCVIDAIDERPPKLALIMACRQYGVPIVSSMGAANKMDAGSVCVADISETSGCPLARIMRKSLRKLGVESGVRVVFSPELPGGEAALEAESEGEKRPLGTIAYMPAIFGMRCAAEALRIILGEGD